MPKQAVHIKPRRKDKKRQKPILTQTTLHSAWHSENHIQNQTHDKKVQTPTKTTLRNSPKKKNIDNNYKDGDVDKNITTHQSKEDPDAIPHNTINTMTQDYTSNDSRNNPSSRPGTTSHGTEQTRINHDKIDSKHHKQRFTQIHLQSESTTNTHYGDKFDSSEEFDTVLFHNINGMKDTTNWYQVLLTMKELNVNIFGFAEINRSLNRGYKKEWFDTIRKIFYYSKTTHSESKVQFESNYKPGGTMTTITGKWQSRVTTQGQDPTGLGRWSYMRIASKKASMIIATAYRPCASQGPNTTWIQQWSILQESGDKNTDPVKYFYADLEKQIHDWKKEGNEILLMIDANEHIGEKPGGLTTIFGKMEMTDLIRHRHPNTTEPNTHARGSKWIDYIFETARVRDNCQTAGILPFGTGYQSDHRALFATINIEDILTTKVKAINSITARNLQQATPKEREKFIQETHFYLNNNNVYQRL
jgi:hypothetical protein